MREKRGPARRRTPWWRRIYDRLVHMNDTPGRIAGGVAVGVFTGVAPTFGLGGIAAVGIAALLRLNIAAALLGAVAGAPPFIFAAWIASSYIGAVLLGLDFGKLHTLVQEGRIVEAGWSAILAYALGNLILTAFLTAFAFVGILVVMRRRVPARPTSPPPRSRAR